MKRMRERFGDTDERQNGLTIIEIMVAMMVFAMIAVSVAYALTLSLSMAGDNRSREAAVNLAAEEIDRSRAAEDIFAVLDGDKTATMNGTTFRVHRETNWVTTTSADASCGSGGGQLRYKRINVSVTWDNMRASTLPVRADTLIAPGSRINDPTLGTILVSVLTPSGAGNAGVTVSAAPAIPAAGAVAVPETPHPTDAQGCSYVLKVVPGNYNVSISKPNSVDVNQKSNPTTFVGVGAGMAASVSFQYDLAGAYTVKYSNLVGAVAATIPSNLDTTFKSSYPLYTSAATSNALSRVVPLHPFSSGYEIFSGRYLPASASSAGCLSPNPADWTTPGAGGAVGKAVVPVAATPGGPATSDVRMGVLTVKNLDGQYLKAVSKAWAPGAGPAGCDGTMTYTFGQLGSNAVPIALPFGAWLLYTGSSASQTNAVAPANVEAPAPNAVLPDGGVLLDPRIVVAP